VTASVQNDSFPHSLHSIFPLTLSSISSTVIPNINVTMILPQADTVELSKRYYGYCDSYYYNCNSRWHRWGRWVLTALLIFAGLVALLFLLCCAWRRRLRSRMHSTPMVSQAPDGNFGDYNNQTYNAPPGPPPPTYGGGYNAGYDGYYGQQGGVTQPPNAYKP